MLGVLWLISSQILFVYKSLSEVQDFTISHQATCTILIYFLAFLASVTASPAAVVGPTDMIFGMEVCFNCGMLIFGE